MSKATGPISFMTFKDTLRFLPICFEIGLVPAIMGNVGIGKTQLPYQWARALNKDIIIIHLAQLEPQDFIGLYHIENGFTCNMPPNWMPNNKFTVRELDKEKNPDQTLASVMPTTNTLNPNGGIIVFDEFNRCKEEMRQAMGQLLNERRIHTYQLPDNYEMLCLGNHTNTGNEVYELDKHLRNRLAFIQFMPETKETIDYINSKQEKSNPFMAWIESAPEVIEYGELVDYDDHFILSPRFVEYASRLYPLIDKESPEFQRKCLSTIMKRSDVTAFLSFRKKLERINYRDILLGKKKKDLEKVIKDNDLGIIMYNTQKLADFFSTSNPEKEAIFEEVTKEEAIKNAVDFLKKIPADACTMFISRFSLSEVDDKKCIVNHKYFTENIGKRLKPLRKVFDNREIDDQEDWELEANA